MYVIQKETNVVSNADKIMMNIDFLLDWRNNFRGRLCYDQNPLSNPYFLNNFVI